MVSNPTKVSIITIVYNNLEGMKKTLNSIAKQTYPNIEHIVIDGGSTDGTLEVINDNAERISSFVSERDNGIADAFNKGLRYVTGDIVFFLNSGDALLREDTIKEVVLDWEENKVDVLFYKVKVSDKDYIPANHYKDKQDKIWAMSDVPHQGAFIKKSVFEKIGGFNTEFRIRMDFEFFAKCNVNKCSYLYYPRVIVSYEPGGTSMQSSNRKRFWNEGMSVKHLYNIPLTYKDVLKTVIYK